MILFQFRFRLEVIKTQSFKMCFKFLRSIRLSMSAYSYILYRGTLFDRRTLAPLSHTPKRAKILYICELDKLPKLTLDVPVSLHSQTQEGAENIIESIYAKAYECGIAYPSHTYSLYFACKPHFYETSLQECEAYFIDHSLFAQLPKHLKVSDIALDAHLLALHIQQGFVYIRKSQILYYIDHAQVLSTLVSTEDNLTQKVQLFTNMFGKHTLQILESMPTTTLLETTTVRSRTKHSRFYTLVQKCKDECYTYIRALFHNKLAFVRNAFGLFGKAQTHILRNLAIALSIGFGLIYPNVLLAHTRSLESQITTLQSQEYDFLSLEHSTAAQTNELNELLAQNNAMYQKISFILDSLNAPLLSESMQKTFALLSKHSTLTSSISFAKNTGSSVAVMDISAPTQSHITQLLKALNTDKSQAKISHITHQDERAYSQIFMVRYE